MTPLKIGLVGCGQIALSVHINILRSLREVELVALAEADPTRREEASRRAPAAAAFADYQELLEKREVEAVVICLPNALHGKAAITALQRGKHVYLEKPLAISLSEAQSVLAAWRQSRRVGMMGFNYRFNALYQGVRQQIHSGRIGELVGARSVFSASPQTLPAWKRSRQKGGGALVDLASHHVDLVHFLFEQEVREVFAEMRSQLCEDDSAALQMRLSNGLLVQSFFSLSAVDEDRFEIYGQGGKIAVDRYRSLFVEINDSGRISGRLQWLKYALRSMIRSPYLAERILAPRSEPSYRAALVHFAAVVRGKQPARPDLSDGYRSLAVIEAAKESARVGRVARVSEPVGDDTDRR